MLFNSLEFFFFLPIVYFTYWLLNKKSLKYQNILLLVASYIFYGWWDYRFLSLILFSTVVDYLVGLGIANSKDLKSKRIYLWISLVCNLGLLGFFKYYNFFIESFVDAFTFFGYHINSVWTLKIILPVGISFYTFQTLSYSLDIYNGKLKPTKSFVSFATFVSFFPQLVAGPIERASQLLPQIELPRKFCYDQQKEGFKLILWGLFKKVVIADSLAPIVDDIFMNSGEYSSTTLVMGAIFFGFQIYGDFSGYSDIAIGTAKLFGVELMSNFRFPYFSRDIGEFWRRWHISLSTWFRDYIYIPLGGSRTSKRKSLRNVFVIFLVSGFWHGANWTFIFWGLFHAILFIPLFYNKAHRRYMDDPDIFGSIKKFLIEGGHILKTFLLVTLGWVFFRSESLSSAGTYLNDMLFKFSYEPYLHPRGYRMVDFFVLLMAFVCFEYLIRKDERNPIRFKNKYLRFFIYTILVFLMLLFYDDGIDRSFIYFQF